jgi:hypothetical protein
MSPEKINPPNNDSIVNLLYRIRSRSPFGNVFVVDNLDKFLHDANNIFPELPSLPDFVFGSRINLSRDVVNKIIEAAASNFLITIFEPEDPICQYRSLGVFNLLDCYGYKEGLIELYHTKIEELENSSVKQTSTREDEIIIIQKKIEQLTRQVGIIESLHVNEVAHIVDHAKRYNPLWVVRPRGSYTVDQWL